VARLDVKSSVGAGVPIELKPSLGELLLPHYMSATDYDAQMKRLQGFGRVQSSFTVPNDPSMLTRTIRKHTALTLISEGEPLRFVGKLPASDDLVFVLLDLQTGTMTVCCDHTMAVNSIQSQVKQAVTRAN